MAAASNIRAVPWSFTRAGASLWRIIGSLSHLGTSACHTVRNCHGTIWTILALILRDLDAVQGRQTREAAVSPAGAVFPPDLIELMKLVLNDVTALLPELKRTSSMKVEIASNILACAAKGERNPAALKAAALLGTVSVN